VKKGIASKGSVLRCLPVGGISVIEIERVQSHGRIKAASDVIAQTIDADCGVAVASGIAVKRESTQGCIPHTGRAAKEGVLPFSRVRTRITAIRRGHNGSRSQAERKEAKRQECRCEGDASIFYRLFFLSCFGLA
jgi:hypothetical protein